MAYTKQHGELALRHLLFCIKFDLDYSQQCAQAAYFKESYGNLFEAHLTHNGWVCKQQIDAYCNELAIRAYGSEVEMQQLGLPSKCFLWMSFVYVSCIALRRPFDIGMGFTHFAREAVGGEFSDSELSLLLPELVHHMLLLRFPESTQTLRLAS